MDGTSKVFPKTNYQTDIISNISLAWLNGTTGNRDATKPFFMFLTPHAPHEPYTPAPRHKGTLAGLTQPPDPAFNCPMNNTPGNLHSLPLVDPAKMDTIYQSRAESLLAIDEMIGHLIDELEKQGVANNTYIFYSCDNGYHLGQHRLPPGKREIFQHDINVALIVSGPGIEAGATVNGLAQNIDLASTWAEIAGVREPKPLAFPIDGKSLMPLLLPEEGRGGIDTIRSYTLQVGSTIKVVIKWVTTIKVDTLMYHVSGYHSLYSLVLT